MVDKLSRTQFGGTGLSEQHVAAFWTWLDAFVDAHNLGLGGVLAPVADLAALKAIDADTRSDKVLCFAETLGLYRFDAESAVAGDDEYVVAPTAGTGRWILVMRIALPRGLSTPVADLAALKAIDAVDRTDKSLCIAESLGLYRFDAESTETADDITVVAPDAGTGRWIRVAEATRGVRQVDSIYDLAALSALHRSGENLYVVRFDDQIDSLLDTIVASASAAWKLHLSHGIGAAHPGGADATHRAQDNGGDDDWTSVSATPRHTQINALLAGGPLHIADDAIHGSAGTAPTLPAVVANANDLIGELLAANALLTMMVDHFGDVTGDPAVHDADDSASAPADDPITSTNAKTATRANRLYVFDSAIATENVGYVFRPFGVAEDANGRFSFVISNNIWVDVDDLADMLGEPCADLAAAKALALADLVDNQFRFVDGLGLYQWDAASEAAGDDTEVIVVTANGADPGRLLRITPIGSTFYTEVKAALAPTLAADFVVVANNDAPNVDAVAVKPIGVGRLARLVAAAAGGGIATDGGGVIDVPNEAGGYAVMVKGGVLVADMSGGFPVSGSLFVVDDRGRILEVAHDAAPGAVAVNVNVTNDGLEADLAGGNENMALSTTRRFTTTLPSIT